MHLFFAWLRAQQSVTVSSAAAELHPLTTRIVQRIVTKHLMNELGLTAKIVNLVDSQSANAGVSKRGSEQKNHFQQKCMFVKDCVEKEKIAQAPHQYEFEQSSYHDEV